MLTEGKRWQLHHGDCLDVMRHMPDASAHSLVCDPPAGIEFMPKDWDSDRGGRAQWIGWLADCMREAMRVLKPGAYGLVWAMPRTQHWTMFALEDAGFELRDVVMHMFGQGWPKTTHVSHSIRKSSGEDEDSARLSEQWEGWGTGLKPAFEPWILVRKPLGQKQVDGKRSKKTKDMSVIENLQEHGVGALNIDACRIPSDGGSPSAKRRESRATSGGDRQNGSGGIEDRTTLLRYTEQRVGEQLGRFPTNTIISHNPDCEDGRCTFGCAVFLLNKQAGKRKSGAMKAGIGRGTTGSNTYGDVSGPATTQEIIASEGGAERFFYCPKAKSEDARGGKDNRHPTVKHPALMEYLCKLVTPPNGIVLDPFAGSGTTGIAAIACGFRFVGVEQHLEYFEFANNRIAQADMGQLRKQRCSANE